MKMVLWSSLLIGAAMLGTSGQVMLAHVRSSETSMTIYFIGALHGLLISLMACILGMILNRSDLPTMGPNEPSTATCMTPRTLLREMVSPSPGEGKREPKSQAQPPKVETFTVDEYESLRQQKISTSVRRSSRSRTPKRHADE